MILQAAVLCLAANVFFEARSESVPGQYAVAQVTMHRAKNDQRKVCKTVYARKQFSWTAKVQQAPFKTDPEAWRRSQIIALTVLQRKIAPDFFNKGADHYHASYVSPRWANNLRRTTVIGHHIFYKGNQA